MTGISYVILIYTTSGTLPTIILLNIEKSRNWTMVVLFLLTFRKNKRRKKYGQGLSGFPTPLVDKKARATSKKTGYGRSKNEKMGRMKQLGHNMKIPPIVRAADSKTNSRIAGESSHKVVFGFLFPVSALIGTRTAIEC